MGSIDSVGSDLDIDLEGGWTSEEDESRHLSSSSECGVGVDENATDSDNLDLYNKWNSQDNSLFKKKSFKEKSSRSSSNKPPKPPRPPVGPSLDAADMKLIREISALTMLRRKRMERIRTLKKMRTEKKSLPSSSSLFAMVVTVIFCFVIIFQGFLGSRV